MSKITFEDCRREVAEKYGYNYGTDELRPRHYEQAAELYAQARVDELKAQLRPLVEKQMEEIKALNAMWLSKQRPEPPKTEK